MSQQSDDELVKRLVTALTEQWEYNHAEHCGGAWPHPEGERCTWPKPDILSKCEPMPDFPTIENGYRR